MAGGYGASWWGRTLASLCPSGSRRGWMLWLSLHFPFYPVGDFSPWNGTTHIESVCSLIDMPRDLFPWLIINTIPRGHGGAIRHSPEQQLTTWTHRYLYCGQTLSAPSGTTPLLFEPPGLWVLVNKYLRHLGLIFVNWPKFFLIT